MESGFNGATFSQIVNTALYIVSGLRRVAFLFFQRLEKSVRKVKKRETSRFFHCCNIGKYSMPVSISGIPRCRDGTKLPWQSLPPEMYSLWRRQK